MYKSDVVSFFGGVVNTATALGVKHPAVSRWNTVIPEKQALKAERLSSGALKYNAELYKKTTQIMC